MRKFTVVFLVGVLLFFSAGELYASWIPFSRTAARRQRDYQTAVGLVEQGEYRLARMQFNNCLASYSDTAYRARVFYGLAEIDYIEEKYEAALENYIRALKKEKLEREKTNYALERAFEAILKTDRIDSGNFLLAYLEKKEKPFEFGTEEVYKQAIEFLEKTGNRSRAIRMAREFHESNPSNTAWTYRLAMMNVEEKKYEAALELLEDISFDTSPQRNKAIFLSAEINYQLGNFETARQKYKMIEDEENYRDRSLYGQAWVDIEEDNIKAGTEKLEKVVADTGSELQLQAARDLGRLNRVAGKEREAIDWYEKAIRLADENKKSKLNLELGDYLVELDRFEEAMVRYRQTAEPDPAARRHLISWYLSEEKYTKADEQLNELRMAGEFKTTSDSYQRAFTYYKLGRLREAKDYFLSGEEVADSELQFKYFRLTGAVYFELGEFKKAKEVYEKWYELSGEAESLYNLALVKKSIGNSGEAIEDFQKVLEQKSAEPWNSRAAFQLARHAYRSGSRAKYIELDSLIDVSYLSAELKAAGELIKLDIALGEEKYDSQLLKRVLEARPQETGDLKREWCELLFEHKLPKEWWQNDLISVLLADTQLVNLAGYRAPDYFRHRGWPDFSLETGDRFLDLDIAPKSKRRVYISQLRTLHQTGNYKKMKNYIPSGFEWKNYPPELAYELGLNMVRYYRQIGEYAEGFADLKRLRQTVNFKRTQLKMIDEWLASLEVSLERYDSAYQRLQKIGLDQLTLSGRLNLAVVAYYRGDQQRSEQLFLKLEKKWDEPPSEFFEAGFRIYRKSDKEKGIERLSTRLLTRSDFSDTEKFELQRENISYWNVEEKYDSGLELLDRLADLEVSAELKIPVYYYRAVFKYNQGELSKALEQIDQVKVNQKIDTEWLQRLLSLEVETHLRLDDWEAAYGIWQQLDQLGSAGEVARRLLVGRGVEQEPEKFKSLLIRLRNKYPEHLTESEENYWRARLEQVDEKPREAIKRYRAYLQSSDPRRRESARENLADLYQKLGEHKNAARQYRFLLEETSEPVYRVYRARQLREAKEYKLAAGELEKSLRELPSRRGWVFYQLGTVRHSSKNEEEAFKNYLSALENGSETEPWFGPARESAVEIGFNIDRLKKVRELLKEMPAGPVKQLFQIELLRRDEKIKQAVKELENYIEKYSGDDRKDLFYKIAPAVYWSAADYEKFLQYANNYYENASGQKKIMRALLELGKIDQAQKMYYRLNQKAVAYSAELLADYYYERKQWRPALGYYEEAAASPYVFYRKADIYCRKDECEKGFESLQQFFETVDTDADTTLIKAGLTLFEQMVRELENYTGAARVLQENWENIDRLSQPVARLGFRFSKKSGKIEYLEFFSNKLVTYPAASFEQTAFRLEELKAWAVLEEIIKKTPGIDHQTDPGLYFSLLLELQGDVGDDYVARINEQLDRAIEEQSSYGPRYQRLLADYYYKQGEHDQATIEYHKVLLLFEGNDQVPWARLGMARIYAANGLLTRARSIYEKITGPENPSIVRKKAKRWLEENS